MLVINGQNDGLKRIGSTFDITANFFFYNKNEGQETSTSVF